MMSLPSRLVTASVPLLQPQVAITIAVDCAYVASQQGNNINTGVYMFDNQVSNGSTGEGGLELHSMVPVGALIGFNSVPIDLAAGSVVISGFTVSQGSVFGSQGYPQQQPPLGTEPAGAYWIGQAMNAGSQTYQIQLAVTVGTIRPITYYINWDPFITAQ